MLVLQTEALVRLHARTCQIGYERSHAPPRRSMQTRKVVNGTIAEFHYSSALCHLANVSYLLGAEKSSGALAEAIRSDSETNDSLARMMDHLKANDIDSERTRMIVGPLLRIDAEAEQFTGREREIVAAANRSSLLKREGRGAFRIPQIRHPSPGVR